MKTHLEVCPQCGKPMQAGSPGNSCPHCLLGLAMNSRVNSPTTAPSSAGHDDAQYPPIEKLVAEFPGLEIQHLIGHGGMGAVYQARQINLDRFVALKILSPRLSRDPAFAERFLREARTMAKLSHPNVVTVFDFGRAGEFYYLTMEFVDGVNLRDTISAHLLSPAEALAIIPQVCDALQYAHDKGVIHRDIKPENILIAKNGAVKIADFGLAKMLQPNPDQFTLTGTQQVLGTMNYMAPEQIETPGVVDHRADLYSLGVVFYELLTGELPLGRFSLPSEKSANVSNRLDDVVLRTLEKDPNRRYQQASQIKTACESIDSPRQHDAPRVDNVPDLKPMPLCRPFPITIEQLYAGLASGYGLMRGFETHLELGFEIRDSVVSHKWATANVRIPLENVTSIRLHRGWIYHHIDIQCDQFEIVSQIPNSKQGSFRVYLKKRELETAAQMVHGANEILACKSNSDRIAPMPPIKARDLASRHGSAWDSHRTLQSVVVFLFFGFCIVAGLTIILGSIFMTAKFRARPDRPPAANVNVKSSAEDSTAATSAPAGSAKAMVDTNTDSVSAIEKNIDQTEGNANSTTQDNNHVDDPKAEKTRNKDPSY